MQVCASLSKFEHARVGASLCGFMQVCVNLLQFNLVFGISPDFLQFCTRSPSFACMDQFAHRWIKSKFTGRGGGGTMPWKINKSFNNKIRIILTIFYNFH